MSPARAAALVLAAALLLACAPGARAEAEEAETTPAEAAAEEPASDEPGAEEPARGELAALVRDGDFGGALARAQSEGDIGALAVAVLGVAMESNDSYSRWFALRAAQGLQVEQLRDYARAAFEKGDRYEKSLALDVLLKADPAGSREQFELALDSPHRSIRLRGLRGLAGLRDPALAGRFIEILSKDPDPDLRAFAVRALGACGSPQAPANLYRALDDVVPMVQEEAVAALVALRSPGLTAVLRRRLDEAPAEDRVRALRLAGLVRNPEMVGYLAPFLADADAEVRANAASAILAIAARAGGEGTPRP